MRDVSLAEAAKATRWPGARKPRRERAFVVGRRAAPQLDPSLLQPVAADVDRAAIGPRNS
jgi:hypothetical protein